MTGTVALIDYGAGNLQSVRNALAAAGCDHIAVTADPAAVLAADRVVLPGVGAFGHCRDSLWAIPGMVDAMRESALVRARPFLGVCVGMQLLATTGEEHGVHQGLGWVPGSVRVLEPADPAARVPHMGWNDVIPATPHPLLDRGEAYFLHSFHFDADHADDVIATSDHGGRIVAAVAHGTVVGVQFHPEKSQTYGLAFLRRFLDWQP